MLEILTAEFNTLDSSLVAAILNDTNNIHQARETLAILRAETFADDESVNGSGGTAGSCPEWGEWGSETSVSLSSLRISEDDCDEDSPGDKVDELADIFRSLNRHTIQTTLDKCQWDVERATDELLNRVYLDGDPEGWAKGVDGFDSTLRVGAGKRKRKKSMKSGGVVDIAPAECRRSSLSVVSGNYNSNAVEAGARSRWDAMDKEIDHLSNGLHLPRATVTSAYHRHNSRLAPTIRALLDAHGGPDVLSTDPSHMEQLQELSKDFDYEVKTSHLDGLLKLCKEDKVAVFEFAEILRSAPAQPEEKLPSPTTTAATISTSKPKPPQRDNNATWATVIGKTLNSPTSLRYTSPPRMNFATPYESVSTYASLRNEAFDKAAAAYRRSKSDRLMGGVAAFYADQGRSYEAIRRSYEDDVAEAMADQNSKPNQLDLHGLTAPQAVRIARERTVAWWTRFNGQDNVTPFNIVTGQGRHSKNGLPVLLPAVSQMLRKEGWRIMVGKGDIIVYGVKPQRGDRRGLIG